MTDILKHITEKLQSRVTEANFEGANIVLYTDNENFFREGEGRIKELVDEIKQTSLAPPKIQRSPAIKSQITENIREVLYANNNYRRKFLNSIGEKIYKGWNPEKVEEWVRLTLLGSAREGGRRLLAFR